MASIFNRVFNINTRSSTSRRTGTHSGTITSPSGPSLTPLDLPQWIPPDFNRDNIRLLVFSDSDDLGIQLLFDSKTLRLVPTSDNESINNSNNAKSLTTVQTRTSLTQVPTSNNPATKPPIGPTVSNGTSRSRPAITRFTHNGRQYELLKSSNDIRTYADYIFGTMPLLFKGTGMKVHTSKSPLQIMMSRIFVTKLTEQSETSVSLCEPETAPPNGHTSFASLQLNRSLSSNASVVSSTISSIDVLGEDLTNQKFGRLYRRWLKFANRTMKQNPRPLGRRHRRCIGIAFIITFPPNDTAKYKHFEEFFCTHAPLIENHFQKIMTVAEANINERNSIAAALLDKFFTFKDELYSLYTRPRLLFPAWYSLTQEQLAMSKRRLLAQQLCSIIDLFTAPKYGDFLNCILSAVLSHQLSWLSTVSPSRTKSKQEILFKSRADYTNSLQNFLQYSPLWGQLVDLFSAYGQRPYICRTVLVGSDASLLDRLIYLLSYFIRPSYLTYRIPNTNLCDQNDEKNRTYKKIRLYMDELISNAIQIKDIEPYSPVHSEHSDNENDGDDDYSVLSDEDSSMNLKSSLNQSKDFYQLTFTSDDNEGRTVDECEIAELLESLILNIERMIIDENQEKPKTPKHVSISVPSSVKPVVPTKTLMSLALFEPNHLGHEFLSITNDYHLDLSLSLISTVTSSYSPDFILQAIQTSKPQDVLRTVFTQHTYDVSRTGGTFLNDEIIDTSITILINLDDTSVKIYSSKTNELAVKQERTRLVQPIIEHAHLAKQYLPADFVLLNMEDSLQEIYFQALAVFKYMKTNKRHLQNQESLNSLTDSASTTSLASGDTDDKISMATNNTVTDSTNTLFANNSQNDLNSEYVQTILRKFQLEKSDYSFLKNILRVLQSEQEQMIN